MAVKDLEVYRRAEELLYRVYPTIVTFPNPERYALSQDMKNNYFKLLAYIALGDSVKSKRKTYLQEADAYLQVIKVQTNLAIKRRYFSLGFGKIIKSELEIIGKMLGAWIKAS